VSVEVAPLDAANAATWVGLFDACGSACFCRFWHFEGKKNDWLARCAQRPEDNRDEQLALVRAGAPEARGLVAFDAGAAVGWMKLTPRAVVPKLVRQGAYRPLDLGADAGIWSIGCLLVRPEYRGSGVAMALIDAAPDAARGWSTALEPARAIEAYPRGQPDGGAIRLHDEEVWVGTERLFERCGYVRVAGEPAYPVMRRSL
jgi:GNAT superfamily N-acetyltransferase